MDNPVWFLPLELIPDARGKKDLFCSGHYSHVCGMWPTSHLMYKQKETDIFTWGVLKVSSWMLPQYFKSIFKRLTQLVLFSTSHASLKNWQFCPSEANPIFTSAPGGNNFPLWSTGLQHSPQDSFDTKPLYPIKVPFKDIIILFLKVKYFKIYFYFVFEIRVAIAFTISKNKLRNHVQFLDKVMKNGAW